MMQERVTEGELVRVSMEVRVPVPASTEDVEEWLRFSLGANGSCKGDNPLLSHCVEPFGSSFDCEFLNETGSEVRTLREEREDGTKVYSVHYKRKRCS